MKDPFPSALKVGRELDSRTVWILIGLYFLLGYAILWAFLKPKYVHEWLLLAGAGFLWNVF